MRASLWTLDIVGPAGFSTAPLPEEDAAPASGPESGVAVAAVAALGAAGAAVAAGSAGATGAAVGPVGAAAPGAVDADGAVDAVGAVDGTVADGTTSAARYPAPTRHKAKANTFMAFARRIGISRNSIRPALR
jgi:hypothetical protein